MDNKHYVQTLHLLYQLIVMLLCLISLLYQQCNILTYAAQLRQPVATNAIQHFGFDGQLTDHHSNWQFLGKGYRAYNPILHRFMAQDTMSPFDKGGINGYVFADNNPIMRFDPSGHFVIADLIPNTVGGWVGFGIATAVSGVIGVAVGILATAPLSVAAGVALSGGIGGISNAAGEYVGHGVDTGQWKIDWQQGEKIASAFDVGVLLGAVTAGVGTGLSKGSVFAKEKYFQWNEGRIQHLKALAEEKRWQDFLERSRSERNAFFQTHPLGSNQATDQEYQDFLRSNQRFKKFANTNPKALTTLQKESLGITVDERYVNGSEGDTSDSSFCLYCRTNRPCISDICV